MKAELYRMDIECAFYRDKETAKMMLARMVDEGKAAWAVQLFNGPRTDWGVLVSAYDDLGKTLMFNNCYITMANLASAAGYDHGKFPVSTYLADKDERLLFINADNGAFRAKAVIKKIDPYCKGSVFENK